MLISVIKIGLKPVFQQLTEKGNWDHVTNCSQWNLQSLWIYYYSVNFDIVEGHELFWLILAQKTLNSFMIPKDKSTERFKVCILVGLPFQIPFPIIRHLYGNRQHGSPMCKTALETHVKQRTQQCTWCSQWHSDTRHSEHVMRNYDSTWHWTSLDV